MVQLKEIIIACKFRSLLRELEDTVNEQRKENRNKKLCWMCTAAFALLIAVVLAGLYANINNVTSGHCAELYRLCVLALLVVCTLAIVAGYFLRELLAVCFRLGTHETVLSQCKDLKRIEESIRKYRSTSVIDTSESGIFVFLSQLKCMDKLVPNWKYIELLERQSCVALLDEDESSVYLCSRASGEKLKLKVGTVLTLGGKSAKDLVLVVGRDKAYCCSSSINSADTVVKLGIS